MIHHLKIEEEEVEQVALAVKGPEHGVPRAVWGPLAVDCVCVYVSCVIPLTGSVRPPPQSLLAFSPVQMPLLEHADGLEARHTQVLAPVDLGVLF